MQEDWRQDWRELDRRTLGVMGAGTFLLALHAALRRGQVPNPIPQFVEHFDTGMLLAYLILPAAILPFLGHNPLQYWRLGRFREIRSTFLIFAIIVVASTGWLAFFPSFQNYYGGQGMARIGQFALGVLLTMICGEFFFRGFLLLPLYEKFGWYALPIVIMPYCLIHVGKPLGELFGSVVFGLGLSYLAVRSGSVLYGVILHWLLAVALPLWIALVARLNAGSA